MTGELSIRDYLAVKAKLPHEELTHQIGGNEGLPLTDDELMKLLTDYYARENLVKRLRKFKKNIEDILAILEPPVPR